MNQTQYIKWAMEVCNQEYNGDLALLQANLSVAGRIEAR